MVDERYHVRAVTRALDVLLAVGESGEPNDLASLARRAGLHPTTALRYLESLRSRGLVAAASGGGYELGSRAFELSAAYLRGLSVWSVAPAMAERLASEANETASVGVLDDGQVLYIAIANGQRELGIQSAPGTRHPAHCTALGKAMLAAMPWAQVDALLRRHPPERLTANTLADPARLRSDLELTARRGYSIDDEERALGVLCIGAPIRDHSGATVAAVSISGPAFRVREHGIETNARLVIEAARTASLRLGGPADARPAVDRPVAEVRS